ncbi:hypothetical protein [Streptomyces sp. NPDC005423]
MSDAASPDPNGAGDLRWGSRGGVLSVLSLLESGVITEEKAKAIRAALDA